MERQKKDPQLIAKREDKANTNVELKSDESHEDYDLEYINTDEETKVQSDLSEEQQLKSYLRNLRALGVKDSYTDEQITYELYELKLELKKSDILFNEGQHELDLLMRDHQLKQLDSAYMQIMCYRASHKKESKKLTIE